MKFCDFIVFISDVLRQDGLCADAVYVRGLCLYYQDNIDKAFQHFQQVLRLAPDHVKARDAYRVGLLYYYFHANLSILWYGNY